MQSDPRTPWLERLNRTEPRNSDIEEMVRLVMRLLTIRAGAVGVFAGMAGATPGARGFLARALGGHGRRSPQGSVPGGAASGADGGAPAAPASAAV
jgi:hypothetical protein